MSYNDFINQRIQRNNNDNKDTKPNKAIPSNLQCGARVKWVTVTSSIKEYNDNNDNNDTKPN